MKAPFSTWFRTQGHIFKDALVLKGLDSLPTGLSKVGISGCKLWVFWTGLGVPPWDNDGHRDIFEIWPSNPTNFLCLNNNFLKYEGLQISSNLLKKPINGKQDFIRATNYLLSFNTKDYTLLLNILSVITASNFWWCLLPTPTAF